MTETRRPCPFCAEAIAAEAVRCPHCRSRLLGLDPTAWHRDHPERKLGGVAAALSRALAVPVAVVRTGFVVLTFVHFIGPLAYAALWTLIPRRPGEPSPLDRLMARVRAEIEKFRAGSGGPDAGRTAPPNDGGARTTTRDEPAASARTTTGDGSAASTRPAGPLPNEHARPAA